MAGVKDEPASQGAALDGSLSKASRPERLKRRPDFLKAGQGVRVHLAPFTIQAAKRRAGTADAVVGSAPRVGFTVTKKVGCAVERNRIRRRLREAIRHAKALSTEPDTDYVVVARREALVLSFARLVADLETAVRKAGVQMSKRNVSGAEIRRRGKS